MENVLDRYAHTSGLRDVDCRIKLILGLGAILISVSSDHPAAPLFIAVSLSLVTLGMAKIPAGFYLRLLAIPVGFAAMSGIVLVLLTGGGEVLWQGAAFGTALSVTTGSLSLAAVVMARTCGGISALYFIALSTPMVEIFAVMRRLHLPSEFVDLSMLIYRFIFVLIGEAAGIRAAQEMRHGYVTFRAAVASTSMLGAMLFIRSWEKGEDLIRAMDARCYDGRLELLAAGGRMPPSGLLCVLLYLALCTAIMVVAGNGAPL